MGGVAGSGVLNGRGFRVSRMTGRINTPNSSEIVMTNAKSPILRINAQASKFAWACDPQHGGGDPICILAETI